MTRKKKAARSRAIPTTARSRAASCTSKRCSRCPWSIDMTPWLPHESESDRIFREAAGPQRYPAWLYIGGVGLQGAGDRLVSAFMPWAPAAKGAQP